MEEATVAEADSPPKPPPKAGINRATSPIKGLTNHADCGLHPARSQDLEVMWDTEAQKEIAAITALHKTPR